MRVAVGLLICVAGEMKDDVQKLEFTLEALKMRDPFAHELSMHEDIGQCLAWQTGKSADEIMHDRELATQRIEAKGQRMWQSGRCAEWFKGVDPRVAHISREVNGPLCEFLVERCLAIVLVVLLCPHVV